MFWISQHFTFWRRIMFSKYSLRDTCKPNIYKKGKYLTFFDLRQLMTELLPTLGYPIKPTEIWLASLCNFPNCLNKLIRAPLPKGCFIEACKATVGYCELKIATHFWVTQVGTKSTLFNTSTKCLWAFSFLRYSSM